MGQGHVYHKDIGQDTGEREIGIREERQGENEEETKEVKRIKNTEQEQLNRDVNIYNLTAKTVHTS